MENLLKKQVAEMTGEELANLLAIPRQTKYVYGISGIQEILNCSEATAKRVKKSGIIDDAIIQNGRKIIVDAEKALGLLKDKKIGR